MSPTPVNPITVTYLRQIQAIDTPLAGLQQCQFMIQITKV
jgi:hypothetical protein